jgi:hypothetical protein
MIRLLAQREHQIPRYAGDSAGGLALASRASTTATGATAQARLRRRMFVPEARAAEHMLQPWRREWCGWGKDRRRR